MSAVRLQGWIAALGGLLLAMPGGAVLAHEGHDHGEPEPVVVSGGSWPRAAARSEVVEAVLVITGSAAVLYLDHAADNAPIAGAQVSLSGEGLPELAWQEVAPATYAAESSLPPGRHALTVVVEAGDVFDLLPLTLDIPERLPTTSVTPDGAERWPWALAGLLALLLGGLVFRRGRRRVGPTAAVSLLGLLLACGTLAHGDEDHEHEHDHDVPAAAAPAAVGSLVGGLPLETARRLGPTQVYVPKSVQRLWGLRTQTLRQEPLGAQAEWPGQVIADPAASSHLEAPEAGHAMPGPAGWPRIGQRVRAGELLLQWLPRRAGLDAERLVAERERLRLDLAQASARVERLRFLSGFIAARELAEAEALLAGKSAELAALARGVAARPLLAPIDGVVIAQALSAGESMEAGALLLQIADPDRLLVEALAPDASLSVLQPRAEALWPERPDAALALQLIDGGGAFRGTRVPWRFALVDPPAGLLVGQPLRVRVQAATGQMGLTLPRAALLAGEDAAPLAWVHVAPEVFESRRLEVTPLDAGRVTLSRGAAAGERVVVQAAVLLGQVR